MSDLFFVDVTRTLDAAALVAVGFRRQTEALIASAGEGTTFAALLALPVSRKQGGWLHDRRLFTFR